jgi:hypothetical protein
MESKIITVEILEEETLFINTDHTDATKTDSK